jgi:predicted MFS family arabinose efflux permease
MNLGWALGGALGGFLASKNYALLFWIDGFTNIGAAILLLFVLSPSRNSATPPRKKAADKVILRPAYTDFPFMVFVALTVLFGTCFFQLFATIPVYYKQFLHLSAEQIGLTMAVNGIIIAVVEMPLVYTLEQRGNYMRYIVMGVLLMALSFAVLNMQGGMWLAMVSTVAVTVGEMLSMPFMNTFWTGRANERNRGHYAGLYTVAWSVAQVIGPYSGGLIAQHLGFHTLWWAITGLGIACAAGFHWLRLNKDRYAVAQPG